MTYTLDDIYSQLNEIKLMMSENAGSGWKGKKAEGLYASAIGEGAEVEGSRFLNLIHNVNTALERTKSNLRGIYSDVKHMVEPWAAVDNAASKYAKTIAMTEEGMKRLRKTTIDNVVNAKIGINYNVSPEELIQYQQKYAQSIGRALRIDNTQQESLAALHAVMDGRENELAAAFENFGVSLNGVADHAGKMFADASKSGLSFEKYSDNVAKNIKIAQNYTFKNGLKGLESMAKKATALKLDMGQVASFADKVSTIEGAIDVASKLQVLGGSFAGIADPLGMLNEGLMDMEGLTDRVIKMVGGMGAFNKQTGEVEVSAFNKQRIKAAAQAMGMDYSQLMESVNAGAKREEITRQISASANATGLDDKMKELIKNSATFENGKAGVSINGNFKTLDDLTNEDYEELVKETQDQAADIKDIARTLRGFKDMEEGTKKQYRAVRAQNAEKLGLGEGVKQLVGWAGEWTFLLRTIAYGSWAKSIMGMFENVANLRGGWRNIRNGKNWTGDRSIFADSMGSGGRYGNGMGRGRGVKEYGRYANKIGKTGEKTITTSTGKVFKVGSDGVMRNASGKVISGAAKDQVLKSASKVASTAEKTAKSAKVTSTLNLSKGIRKTKQGVNLIKAGKAGKVIASGVKTTGTKVPIIGGLIAGGIEAFENKDKFKDRATRGEAVGKTAGAAIGATAGAAALAWIPVVGPLVGGVVGEFLGKHIGGFIGKIQGNRVKKNRDIVDKQLSKYGIERKGDYKVRELKKIDEALQTGELSNKMRKKLIKDGDIAMLDVIDKKKREKDEKKRKDRNERLAAIFGGRGGNIAKGTFTVTNAYFNGEAFGGTNIERKGEYSDEENKAIDEALKSGKISKELKQKLSESGDDELLKAIEKRKKNPTEGNGIMAQKNKFGVANFEIGVANFGKLGSIMDAKREKRKENIQKMKVGMKAGFGASESMAGLLTFNPISIFGGINKIKSAKKKREELKAAKESGISNIKGFPEEGFSSELAELKKSSELFGQKKGNVTNQQQSENQKSFNGGKIDINISGTIKLEGTNGERVDITRGLLKSSNFIREITKLITQRIGENQVGSNRQDNNNMARTI